MADQLVTLAQVKARLFPPGFADVTEDALLTELIEQVTDWIHEYTGRRFVPENGATYVLDSESGSRLNVPRGIRAVTTLSVATSDQPDTGGVYANLTAADILLRPASIDRRPGWPATQILVRGSSPVFARALNGVRIVGDFGFAAVPPSVAAVALDAVATAYTGRRAGDSDVLGADASPVAPWARYFSHGTEQRATLDRYRAGASMGIA